MDEPYRIEVLHILNPHVIFVESQALKNEPVIQQVGIYGVLPVNKTIDIDGNIVAERCQNWPVAANTILRELLADNKNRVYFVPFHVDERSSIFDENNHLFGDIIVKARKNVSVTDHLTQSAVADRDEIIFLQKLSSGSLKLKLSTARTEEVLRAIKKYYQKQRKVDYDWQKTINTQTSVYQETKKITSKLTIENLKLLDRNAAVSKNVTKAIEMKEKDFSHCKDANLVSLGCATKRHNQSTSATHSKQLTDEEDKYSPKNMLNNVKQYLETYGTMKENKDSNFNEKTKECRINLSTSKENKNETEQLNLKVADKSIDSDDDWDNICEEELTEGVQKNYEKHKKDNTDQFITQKSYQNKKHINSGHQIDDFNIGRISHEKDKTAQNVKQIQISSKKTKERRLVYCPDMEMSADNLKKLVPITIREDSAANFANTVEVETDNTTSATANTLHCDINSNASQEIMNARRVHTPDYCMQTTAKTSKPNELESKLNVSHLQKKLQELKSLRKNANNSMISNSDDQIDLSPKSIKNEDEVTFSINPNGIDLTNTNLASDFETKTANRTSTGNGLLNSNLQAKLEALKMSQQKVEKSSTTSDTSVKDTSSSTEQSKINPDLLNFENNTAATELDIEKLEPFPKSKPVYKIPKLDLDIKLAEDIANIERNVNPFKNLDCNRSVFVDKLISPILMVHTKNDNLILPKCELRDVPFNASIRIALRSMRVEKPKRLQTVTWSYILRGQSMFIIGPVGNGKTMGYVPAICNLLVDARTQLEGVGPICIIVCATAMLVSEMKRYCKRFLMDEEQIVTFYAGMDTAKVTTSLLNGCHVLICTAPALVTLLETDFGVDLRRLGILVLDDCERLSQVYSTELNKITSNVNAMLKNRADKAFKVQFIVASRLWCDFMTPLAKKAPDTVIAIGASQECVLYSRTKTSVSLVKSEEKKMDLVVKFLEQINSSKRTVIVCREDKEVDILAGVLTSMRYIVFNCDNTMTLQDLYKLNEAWTNYQEPISGPILICCDGNLTHLNITNANYLIHFSLPPFFSMFCKRFSVLNENYASIFGPQKDDVKIKILLDQTNVEQLPKILHFIKRCTNEPLPDLDYIIKEILETKDLKKAEILIPICNNLLMLGECIDTWNCSDRHTVFKEFDEPKDWMPKQGVITFKINHFDSAVTYSARVLTNITKSDTVKYPNNYNTLSLKMGMHYSKEINRKLHGVPHVGDVCAVAIKQNFFERCRVMKVIPNDKKVYILINLIDEEQMTVVSDVFLYYLPEELKAIETHVVKVRLANIQPKDRDVTFSLEAKEYLQKMTDQERESGLYMRGKVVLTLGNCIFVDTAEACFDLSSLGETVVKRNFTNELLKQHAEPNHKHIEKLKKVIGIVVDNTEDEPKPATESKDSPKWAYLDRDDFSEVIFSTVLDANTIFIRHTKFLKVIDSLLKDIQKYVEKAPKADMEELFVGNFVVAEFPGVNLYERARIDRIVDEKIVNCFFVDNGDLREVAIDRLRPITDNILYRVPFQAIECRLVGVKPPGNADVWPEFSTCWLDDNCFEDKEGRQKQLFVKYFTKEKATVTGGHKYGVVLIDTSTEQDVVINKMMIELNLAKDIEDEQKYIDEPLDFTSTKSTDSSLKDDDFTEKTNEKKPEIKDLVPIQNQCNENYDNNTSGVPLNILLGNPIRSMPLIDSDNESDILDKWDVNVDKNFMGVFGQPSKSNTAEDKMIATHNTTGNASVDHKENMETKETVNLNDKPKGSSCSSNLTNSSSLKMIREKEKSQPVVKSPSLDSDDIEIDDARNNAFDIFRRKLCKNVDDPSNIKKNKETSNNDTLDSDDLSSLATDFQTPNTGLSPNTDQNTEAPDLSRKPKLTWHQNESSVNLKINLIGVEYYVIDFKDRHIKFETWHNDTKYAFSLELYGAILPKKCLHSNKGQYILVRLVKMLPRKWLNLTKDYSVKKWIVYDVDAIDLSTDDENDDDATEARKVIKYNHEKLESASEDEDHVDDLSFKYMKH